MAGAHAVIADIDAHSLDHHDRALDEFQDVLKTDPDNASALRGAGYAYLQRRDYQHSGEYFKRASEHDSKDPRVHYYNALLMNQTGAGNRDKSSAIKKELEMAIALDPKLADAYSLLAYAQATSGEPEKGLVTMKKAVDLSPRNEIYQINLANIYLANREADEAIALLQGLCGSATPGVASQARTALLQAQDFKEKTKSYSPHIEVRSAESVPAVRDSAGVPEGKIEAQIQVETPVASAPVRFVKGKLIAVDCSGAPQVVLNVATAGRSLKLYIGDSKHVVLIGADDFSCDWKNKNVTLNYRERADGDGDVVSLELH
jgi:Tfp pilus assembly protein PilF